MIETEYQELCLDYSRGTKSFEELVLALKELSIRYAL